MKNGGTKRLDFGKINKRIARTISTEEALKDVLPVEWPESVMNGKGQVFISELIETICY